VTVKIHEFQAKKLLAAFSVPVERGETIGNLEEIDLAIGRLGPMERYAVKAQVHAGGRGLGHFANDLDGGGVRIVQSKEEAAYLARRMLGNRLITKQTGPDGAPVSAVYIAEVVEPLRQFYLSILIDRGAQRPVILASADGGGNIEDLAENNPKKILREYIVPTFGLEDFQIRKLAFELNLGEESLLESFSLALRGMWRLFWEKDASLVEINPLALTADGRLCAIDGKINFEDNGLFRHADVRELRDVAQEDPKEVRASQFGLNYVALDGTVACLTNGAGLAMATMDMLNALKIKPANFLDLGDNSPQSAIAEAVRILLDDSQVQCILVNIFGGAMRGDIVAGGILDALGGKKMPLPLVVRIEGANAEEGREILRGAIPEAVFADGMAALGDKIRRAMDR
jgi:succinyl-CoA synthetase beta subunit